jgi:hypothetical protein
VLKISPFQDKPQSVLEELRNSVLRYDDPLEPVAQDDWGDQRRNNPSLLLCPDNMGLT